MDFGEYLCKRIRNGRRLAPNSISSHIQTWRIFARWYEQTYAETFDPSMLTRHALDQFRHYLLDEQRVKANTWNLRRAGLVLICEYIQQPELMNGIEHKKKVGTTIKWLDASETNRITNRLEQLPKRAITAYEYKRAIRNQAICALMIYAGLRVCEVMALRKEDVKINPRSGTVIIRAGKGDIERTVPLCNEARSLLTTWHTARPDGLLFDISIAQAKRIPGEIGRAAGISNVTAHKLRHTFAHHILPELKRQGKPLNYLQRLLGHARLETTALYLEPSEQELAELVEHL